MNFLTHKTSLLEMWFCLRWTWYDCSNLMSRSHRVSWLPFQMLKICHSVHFSCSIMSDSLQPYGLQHARLPCPSPTPRACSNSCSSSRWCHPTISSSVVPFSSCLQSFPASGSLPMSHHLHQAAKVLEFQLQHQSFQWIFRTDYLYNWLVWSPCSSRDSQEYSLESSKASVLWHSAFFMDQLSHPHITTGKTIALTRRTFVSKVMSQIFNMLSRLAIAFLPRSKHLLISCLQSSAVILVPPKIKSVTISIVSPSISVSRR